MMPNLTYLFLKMFLLMIRGCCYFVSMGVELVSSDLRQQVTLLLDPFDNWTFMLLQVELARSLDRRCDCSRGLVQSDPNHQTNQLSDLIIERH